MNSTCVGIFTKTFGFEGHLHLKLSDAQFTISEKEWVFIKYDGLLVPFFVEECSPKNPQLFIIKLKGVDHQDQAEDLRNCEFFTEGKLQKQIIEPEEVKGFKGFKLINEEHKEVGEVVNIEEIPGNPVLEVKINNELHLIPFHEDFILELDEDNQCIQMKLPEGLID